MLLHDLLAATAARLPAKTALVCGARRIAYGELHALSGRLAAQLQGRGVEPGERVVLFMDNTVEMVVALQAVWRLGAVAVPINPLTKAEKLAWLLEDAGALALVSQPNLRAECDAALDRCPHAVACVIAEDSLADAAPDAARPAGPQHAEPASCIDQDLAAIVYTSGTTGAPKGVMLSHLNLRSAVESVVQYLGLRESDVILSALPLSFGYGLNQILTAFMVGATVVLERSFSFPVKIVQALERERATVFPGVPTMYALLVNIKTLHEHDLSSLRILTNAAAALSPEHIARLRALLPQARLYSMYGQTECTRISYLPPDELDARALSVGRGMPNQECWLVDEHGQRLPFGSTGELVVRGSHVMRGYWRQPELSAQKLRPGPLPGERVLHTGDLFRTDAEGWLYFVARRDDIIKTRGEKVSPREVEDALHTHEAVLEAAVVGVPDDLLGQAVKAFVVLKPGHVLTERDLMRHCGGRLEAYMIPKHIEFRDDLPKSPNGKIRKTELA